MKAAPFLLLAWMLVGCAALSEQPVAQTVTPAITGDVFVARDGTRLPEREWDSATPPHAIVVALHGMSDYSNFFDGPGQLWAKEGITSLAYDQRGFGRGPHPGEWFGSDAMRTDFEDFVTAAHARFPGVPVFALGESMGGAVVLTALTESTARGLKLDGVILSAPAVWSRADMPWSYRVALFLVAHLAPDLGLCGNGLKIVASDNNAMLRALGRDPYFQNAANAAAVYGLVNLMDEARHAPEHLGATPPILFLYGKNDQIIPAEPTKAVIAELGPRAKVLEYDKGYHMLMRDLEGPKVQQDVADWILAGLPICAGRRSATKAGLSRYHPWNNPGDDDGQ